MVVKAELGFKNIFWIFLLLNSHDNMHGYHIKDNIGEI